MVKDDKTKKPKWIKGKIKYAGEAGKIGLISAEDGTLIEFDENVLDPGELLKDFSQISGKEVLLTLAADEPEETGVRKAEEILPLS